MKSTFIALPLTNGDAFLLRTPDSSGKERVILVDSGKKYGKNTRELAKILANVSPRINHIDIAVCTHSDADHSNGFWFFADDWYDLGRTIGEYWLPGRWANAMPMALTDPAGFSAMLFDGALESAHINRRQEGEKSGLLFGVMSDEEADLSEEDWPLTPLEGDFKKQDYANSFGLSLEEFVHLKFLVEEEDADVDPFDIATETLSPLAYSISDGKKITVWPNIDIGVEARSSYLDALDTAKAIRKIALSALQRDIRVRWFDFGLYSLNEKPSGGEPGLLEPLCSVEVIPKPKATSALTSYALFKSLRLSRQNVESLVFYRPETGDHPGVVFLGDSRLAYGVNRPDKEFPIDHTKPDRKILITAPHHGSNKNDFAYGVITDWIGDDQSHFVRNGGQSNQRLGDYLQYDRRRCAQCVQCHGKEWNQWVTVHASGTNWIWPPNSEECGTPNQ